MLGRIRKEFPAGAERGCEDVTLGMRFGVFGTNNAGFDEPSYVRVVAREALGGLAADQVQTAVADVREKKLVIDDCESGAGGPHTTELRMLETVALDSIVRSLQTDGQSCLRIAAEVMVIDVAHGLDGKAAGFLTTFVSTHAVGNDGQAALVEKFVLGLRFPVKIGVLIVVTLKADIGQAGGFKSRFRIPGINRHRRRVSYGPRIGEVESR